MRDAKYSIYFTIKYLTFILSDYFLLHTSTNLKNSSRNSLTSSSSLDWSLDLPQHNRWDLKSVAFIFLSKPIDALICCAISPQYSSASSIVSIFLSVHWACFKFVTSDLYDVGFDCIITKEEDINTYGMASYWFLVMDSYIVSTTSRRKTSHQVFFILNNSCIILDNYNFDKYMTRKHIIQTFLCYNMSIILDNYNLYICNLCKHIKVI